MLETIELFSGAGLLGYAFKRAGFKLVRAIEINQVAASTYRHNLGDHVQVADITKVAPAGRVDVIIAGPPCQGFSTLGKLNGNDPRNRLCFQVVRWTVATRPKLVVIENVAKFAESHTWQRLRAKFEQIGYRVTVQLLDASDFGVAQRRIRSFTFATRIGEFPKIIPPKVKRKTVRDAWVGLNPKPTGVMNHYAPQPTELALSRMKLIPPGGDKRDVMRVDPALTPKSWWSIPGDVTDVWGRMEWNQPSNTLRTCLLNPSKGRYIHPEQNRVISLREAARIHSVPDHFEFVGLPTQIAKQIGNSVPPLLGKGVARIAAQFLS